MIDASKVGAANSIEDFRGNAYRLFAETGVQATRVRATNTGRPSKTKSGIYSHQPKPQISLPVKQELRAAETNEQQSVDKQTYGDGATIRHSEGKRQIKLLKEGPDVRYHFPAYGNETPQAA